MSNFPENKITVAEAMDRITTALKEDSRPGSYRDSWIANIAMPIYDQRGRLDLKDHKDCNKMAEILLKHFFGLTKREEPSLEELAPKAIIYRATE